jgi:hypothetical protein
MLDQGRIPTRLHYKIHNVGDRWVLACEDIPISSFDSRRAARRTAALHMAAARSRGDCAVLVIDHHEVAA